MTGGRSELGHGFWFTLRWDTGCATAHELPWIEGVSAEPDRGFFQALGQQLKQPLAGLSPALGLGWTSWNISSLSVVDTA